MPIWLQPGRFRHGIEGRFRAAGIRHALEIQERSRGILQKVDRNGCMGFCHVCMSSEVLHVSYDQFCLSAQKTWILKGL